MSNLAVTIYISCRCNFRWKCTGAYKIDIESIDQSRDLSMRRVYELGKHLS